MRTESIIELTRLEQLAPEWDRLAVAAGRPFCAPGWLLPWWREAAPPGAELRSVACFDDERLVALAPLFLAGRQLLPLGTGATTRVEPVTEPGWEGETAEALAATLAEADLLRFAGIPAGSPWPELAAEASRSSLHEDERMSAPVTELTGSFDDWLASRSSRMRNRLRHYERLVRERQGQVTLDSGPGAVRAFAALHRARWAGRGGSGVLDEPVERAVASAARELPPERFRLFTVTAPEGVVAAALYLAAGSEVSSWLGGFDERWNDVSPQLLLGAEAIKDAYARGERRVDFGAGSVEYKHRLATREETLRWTTLLPPGPQRLRLRAQLLRRQARLAASRRLSDEHKRRLKRLLGRPG